MSGYFDSYADEVYGFLKQTLITDNNGLEMMREKAFDALSAKIKQIKENKKSIFFAGNGASCTMAEHMSHDFFQNAGVFTHTCAETAHITAISNDLSYEDVFAYKISRVLAAGDALFTISSSGNSPNVIKAIEAAIENQVFVVTLSGMKPDNKSRTKGDINIYVPAATYGLVESAHAVILHAILDCYLDKYEGGRH